MRGRLKLNSNLPLPTVSLILPVLNEAAYLGKVLAAVKQENVEVIVVDGGSHDGSLRIASGYDHCLVIESEKGRGAQMNMGAAAASGDILLFLHADTLLPKSYLSILQHDFWASGRSWGRFDVRLTGDRLLFRLIEAMMNVRSSLTGICTGDQAMFIKRATFEQLGGFASIPLMEDVEISRRLKRHSHPFRIRQRITTSSRRWEDGSIVKTVLLMWRLRLLFFFGVAAEDLLHHYHDQSHHEQNKDRDVHPEDLL